jgi:hypothetical protein
VTDLPSRTLNPLTSKAHDAVQRRIRNLEKRFAEAYREPPEELRELLPWAKREDGFQGVPELKRLLDYRDLMGILGMSRMAVVRLVQERLDPIPGAVLRFNRRGNGAYAYVRVHAWALAILLRLPHPWRCPVCRKLWRAKERKEKIGA